MQYSELRIYLLLNIFAPNGDYCLYIKCKRALCMHHQAKFTEVKQCICLCFGSLTAQLAHVYICNFVLCDRVVQRALMVDQNGGKLIWMFSKFIKNCILSKSKNRFADIHWEMYRKLKFLSYGQLNSLNSDTCNSKDKYSTTRIFSLRLNM